MMEATPARPKKRATITVCILNPGSEHDEIKCTLKTRELYASAGSGIEYEALSYVWGDPEDTLPITVNEKNMLVTRNLHAALIRLRDPLTARTMWIDAICIDQANLKERADQVRIMGDIYAAATRTVIWLGEEREDDSHAFSIIREIIERKVRANELTLTDGGDLDGGSQRSDSFELSAANVLEILAIFARPWFTRVWVIQEVLNASTVVFVCGKETLSWSWLCYVLVSFAKDGFFTPPEENIAKHGSDSGVLHFAMIESARVRGKARPFQVMQLSSGLTAQT